MSTPPAQTGIISSSELAYDWASLLPGSIVVDVGGGIGSATMMLAGHPSAQKLKFIVQDRLEVVDQGVGVWKAEAPEIYQSGMVTLQGMSTID
jgi:hypothetical protein